MCVFWDRNPPGLGSHTGGQPMAMEPVVARLGSSLPVPWVQELAKETLVSVPPRYLRYDQDPTITFHTTSDASIPVIDMESLLSGNHMDIELKKLDSACKEWGFFQLTNHGVSISLLEKLKLETQEFFNLPMEEKKKFWQQEGHLEGFGQILVKSEEQKLDWCDLFLLRTLPTFLRKPHLLPKLPLPFRDTLEVYINEMKNLGTKILVLMAKALKLEASEMMELFEDGMQTIRMNYYPPCPQPEQVMGFTPHSDAVGLTILLQVNEMEGLQIKKDGIWIPIVPLPNAFVVNVGDILEIVTNGAYQSIEHRAIVNPNKERLSIAAFHMPKIDGEIGPAQSLITSQTPPMYRRITVLDYFRGFLGRQLNGKTYTDEMRVDNKEKQEH